MNRPESNPRRARLDEATSRRLARLRTLPVDTSRLERAITEQIPRPQVQPRRLRLGWLSPMRAIAASVLVFALFVALVLNSSSGPVLASADRLAEIHEEVLHRSGTHVTQVDSVAAANSTLASKCPGLPAVPEIPEDHVISCCVHEIGRKKMACIAMEVDSVPVSIAVAPASDVKTPTCEARMINGVAYHIQSHNDINMVMIERDGRWVCVMGKLPVDRLVALASTLR